MTPKRYSHILQRAVLGIILGILYAVLAFEDDSVTPVGAMTGFTIGVLTAWLDHYVFPGKLRRKAFTVVLFTRTLAYLAAICLSVLLVSALYLQFQDTGITIMEFLRSGKLGSWIKEGNLLWIVLYSFVFILLFQYINLTIRLLGPNVLRNYIIGRYHTPKEEERIFMFLDIKSSTTIAEKLGHFKWHNMLNDFFFDIAAPVYQSQGSIYQYVGDEVVISWPKRRGIRNNNCIRCFFRIQKKIEARRDQYLKRYGYELVFKAGYHIGKVVTGEIGDLKRDIVFHGDTINTASRIQDECNRLNRQILLSGNLLEVLDLGQEFEAEYMGNILLRGKGEEIQLYSVKPLRPLSSIN